MRIRRAEQPRAIALPQSGKQQHGQHSDGESFDGRPEAMIFVARIHDAIENHRAAKVAPLNSRECRGLPLVAPKARHQ
jgi:hypothetical protein